MPKRNPRIKPAWAAVLRGADTKAAAIEYGCSLWTLEKLARDAGMRRRLVTTGEFQRVVAGRLTNPLTEQA